jgi:membrane protease YdiL (CAAX protease family)
MESKTYPLSTSKPMGWLPSLAALLSVALLYYFTHYHFVPYYTRITGEPYLVGYLIGWVSTVAIIFTASLIFYRLEGNRLTISEFSIRFRLRKMSPEDWGWTVLLIIVVIITYFGLTPISKWLATFRLFAPHPDFPPDMSPAGVSGLKPGVLFGMTLKGKWWIVIVYFIGWILNILGEEFWYRGWMLPRQEVSFGKYAWIINGSMFAFQHWMQPWNFFSILPGALFMSFVLQLRKNTWIGIIQHGLINLGLFVHVLRGVIG